MLSQSRDHASGAKCNAVISQSDHGIMITIQKKTERDDMLIFAYATMNFHTFMGAVEIRFSL